MEEQNKVTGTENQKSLEARLAALDFVIKMFKDERIEKNSAMVAAITELLKVIL